MQWKLTVNVSGYCCQWTQLPHPNIMRDIHTKSSCVISHCTLHTSGTPSHTLIVFFSTMYGASSNPTVSPLPTVKKWSESGPSMHSFFYGYKLSEDRTRRMLAPGDSAGFLYPLQLLQPEGSDIGVLPQSPESDNWPLLKVRVKFIPQTFNLRGPVRGYFNYDW